MAEIIPYQPVEFNGSRDACLHGQIKPLKVNTGDITQFQFKVDPCGDSFNFAGIPQQNGGNWVQTGDKYCHTPGVSGNLRFLPTLVQGVSIRFQFTVSDMTEGEIDISLNFIPSLSFTVTQNGSYEFWYTPTSTSVHSWFLEVDSAFDGCIVDPSMIAIDNRFRVFICDDEQNLITELDNTSPAFNFTRNFFTVTIDWDLYISTPGCYVITVLDPCINTCSQNRIIGQGFFDINNWILSDGPLRTWQVANGTAGFKATGVGIAELISHQSLCAGKTYEITYTLANMLNNTFQLNVGGTLGVLRSTNGTFTETITAGGSAAFRLIGDSPLIGSDFDLTNLTFEAIAADTVPDYVSNLFDYGTHSCSHLINATNNEDAFGMGFYDTGFNPRVRVESKIFPHTTDQERLTHQDSKGKKFVVWGNTNWIELLRIINETPHVFKFLSLLPLFNHWYIGNKEYFVNDDEFPEISWNKFRNLGSIDLEIRLKEELIKQQDCTEQETSGIIGTDQELEEQSSGLPVFTTLSEQIAVKIE